MGPRERGGKDSVRRPSSTMCTAPHRAAIARIVRAVYGGVTTGDKARLVMAQVSIVPGASGPAAIQQPAHSQHSTSTDVTSLRAAPGRIGSGGLYLIMYML